jgi:hypothetical protein
MLIYKWSNGFESIVTFESHLGDQMLLSANPADNWARSNPRINVRRLRRGEHPLSGTFQLSFGGQKSRHLDQIAPVQLVAF